MSIGPQFVNVYPEIILILQNKWIDAPFLSWVAFTPFLSPNPPVQCAKILVWGWKVKPILGMPGFWKVTLPLL